MKTKFIFVAGGVMSGIGKGTSVASMGRIFKSRGFKVTAMKIDPYINLDAGTMNPTEHGEVFVTTDGDETDQDLGNYERFLDQDMGKVNYMTTGRVYQSVISRERNLEYGGACVEVVPHIPEEVIARIERCAAQTKSEIVLIEIGGTVGEYQNILFLEAARMMKLRAPEDVLFAMISYLPIPSKIGEMKTKPTQTAVRTLNGAGIQPDILLCRADTGLDAKRKKKIALFCSMDPRDVISAPDVASVYEIPLNFERDALSERMLTHLKVRPRTQDLAEWEGMVARIHNPKRVAKIAIVGKYFESGGFVLTDSYISVIEAVKHAAYSLSVKPHITWLSSEEFEKHPASLKHLKQYDGVIIPGGFGKRGIEGKIAAIGYARREKIPLFGLCLGMQLAVVEFARNVAGLAGAHSEEINPTTPHAVIHLMHAQKDAMEHNHYGGTMRLGAYPCSVEDGTIARRAYGVATISERHRHRYEFNNAYREKFARDGLVPCGVSPDGILVEMVELKKHPFFVGVQFHPEFQSRPLRPHPLFKEFIKASLKKRV